MNMRYLLSAAALALAAPVAAQDTNTNTTNSGANANSGSVSGAESNGNQQGQTQNGGNNAGIGSSRNDLSSTSGSNATAITASDSASRSNSDQSQGQSANNSQGQGQSANNSQSQGQTANNGQGQTQGQSTTASQSAANMQGVSVTNQFNSTNLKRTYVGTNTAVPLAASSSFSSDYCGGTASGGASVAPIGLSIGGAAPVFDNSCRYLRLAEKAGMLGANYHNMGYIDQSGRAMSLMAWAVCMAGPQQDKRHKGYNDNVTMKACLALGLLGGEDAVPAAPPVAYVAPPVTPDVNALQTQKPNTAPTPDDYSTLPPKTPRGDAGTPAPLAVAH